MASVVHVMTTIWTTSLIPAINQLSNVVIGYIKRVDFVECKLDPAASNGPHMYFVCPLVLDHG